jgi:hypothetical protein
MMWKEAHLLVVYVLWSQLPVSSPKLGWGSDVPGFVLNIKRLELSFSRDWGKQTLMIGMLTHSLDLAEAAAGKFLVQIPL